MKSDERKKIMSFVFDFRSGWIFIFLCSRIEWHTHIMGDTFVLNNPNGQFSANDLYSVVILFFFICLKKSATHTAHKSMQKAYRVQWKNVNSTIMLWICWFDLSRTFNIKGEWCLYYGLAQIVFIWIHCMNHSPVWHVVSFNSLQRLF